MKYAQNLPQVFAACFGKGVWAMIEKSSAYVHMLNFLTLFFHCHFSFCENL